PDSLGYGHAPRVAGGNGHGEDLRPKTRTVARGARNLSHVPVVALLHLLRFGLFEPAMQERHDAFEFGVVGPDAAVAVLVAHVHLFGAAFEHGLAHLGRQLLPRGVDVEAHDPGQAGQQTAEVFGTLAHRPRRDGTVREAQIGIGHHEIDVDLLANTETRAFG